MTRNQLLDLSRQAGEDATRRSQRGDTEGSFYCRGLRDAYATAAAFWPSETPLPDPVHHGDVFARIEASQL